MTTPTNAPQHDQFLRLFSEYQPALHMFVRSMLLNRSEASEVIQNVAVVLWKKSELLERYLAGQTNAEETVAFQSALKNDSELRALYLGDREKFHSRFRRGLLGKIPSRTPHPS